MKKHSVTMLVVGLFCTILQVWTSGQVPASVPPAAQTPAQCLADVRAYVSKRSAELRPLTSETSMKLTAERTAMIKDCAAKFDIKTVADKDLPGLADLYADAGSLDLANAAVTRALASKLLSPTDRATLLSQSIRLMLREPKGAERNARIEKVVDRLDAMPAATIDQRIAVHQSMNRYYRADDIDAGIIKHSTWLIDTGKTLPPELRKKYGGSMLEAYEDMAEAWAGQSRNAEALTLLRRAPAEWPEVADAAARVQPTLDRYMLVGTPAAPIAAPRFLNAAPATTRMDMTGAVTLLEFTAHWCGPCKESYPGINRLRARFGAQGFRVVLATELYGYFQTEPNLDAATELDRDRAYFAEHHLDVPVAVGDHITVSVKNGQVVYSPGPNINSDAYKVGGIPQIHVIDRKGTIRLIMVGYDDANEPALARLIDKLLKEKMTLRPVLLAVAAAIAIGSAAQETPAARVTRVVNHPLFTAALAVIDRDHDRLVSDIVTLTEIPAPSFKEQARGEAFLRMLQQSGLSNVERDPEGNVMGIRKGSGGGPFVAIAAHLDTVFPEGTDVHVKRTGTRLTAPGVGDNSRSLAVLLAIIRAMDAAGIRTASDILFVGDVGEEGLGDLRGMKYLFTKGRYKDRITQFIALDASGPGGDIVTGALGSKRYEVTFKGPGGHSYSAFGLVNPAFAMANAIQKFSTITVPTSPKTTFNVGRVGGGTSVNSIPMSTWMEVDMRSESPLELEKVETTFLAMVRAAVTEENRARSTSAGAISTDVKLIGARPSGRTPATAPIVQIAAQAATAAGLTPEFSYFSTDANLPISLGIPAIRLNSGGTGDRAHAPDEWIDVEKTASVRGIRVVLATLLALAGLQ